MKMSNVYRMRGKSFRYDYDNGVVIWVEKAGKEEYENNQEWQKKFGRNLWDIDEDGYVEIMSVGMMKSNWCNKENRDTYLNNWIDELEEETACLSREYLLYG